MNFLSVSGINKRNERGIVLQDINFTQERFQKIAIAGETGSGKSTLLKIIAGLIQPDEGRVLFEGEKLLGPLEKLLPGHPRIGYLSQHFELRNNYRVEEILEMANKMPEEEAAVIFDVCRISHLLKRKTDQLSGGEKQRIATARLLITRPRLLLLDEPYSNLDMVHKHILKAVIKDIGERLKVTCIMISHDPLDTLSWADEIMVMKDGLVVQQDTPTVIYNQPTTEYVAGLFGDYNLISEEEATFLLLGSKVDQGKRLLIRPEDVTLSKETKTDLVGEVRLVRFFGSYFMVEVYINGVEISARTSDKDLKVGDKVFVKFNVVNTCYL